MSLPSSRPRLVALFIGLAVCGALIAAPAVVLAAPTTMTVQGYLAETDGTPVTGDYAILVSLYTGRLAPTSFWDEPHSVTVVDGIFDATLGGDVGNPLTVSDFADNDEVWFGITITAGPGVPAGGEQELPRRRLSATGYTFAAGHAGTADTASHAGTADNATNATTATTATSASGLTCTGCVSTAHLGFDPATQAELESALAALQIPSSLHGFTGGTVTSGVTVQGSVTASSFVLTNGTTICTDAGNCGGTLTSLTCVAPNDIPVYDHNQGIWACGAGSSSGGVNASDLSCSGCVSVNELSFDPATQAEMNTALSGYVTSSSLTSTLASYVTSASLSSTLSSYVTGAGLATALSGYVTASGLATALSGYVTTNGLTSTLASYALAVDLPSSVDGLAGGSITSDVDVDGVLSANIIRQNGQVVCDASGNCGATLGTFDPATACSQEQVLQWTGSAWQCADAGGGSVPSQPCTGAGQALQWDGNDWACINVRDSGLSKGEANGYEARDDWGDAWDGIARSPRPWAAANQACIDDGGRLPTVTELWRNRANYGTGNISTPDDDMYHWTVSPSYRANYYTIMYLSTASHSDAVATGSYAFRCIWKSQKPAGFSGNRCFGPPGAECTSRDSFYNIDTWSRAPQYYPAAKKECELENAAIATTNDYEAQIEAGTAFVNHPDHGWPFWHWTLGASYYSNGYTYLRVVKWTKNAEPWWSATAGHASHAGPSSVYMFRCVGKKDPASGFQPEEPACQGGTCFEITTASRNRLIADAIDRPAAQWQAASKDCAAAGGTLPTADEVNQLVQAGWGNGVTTRYLWSGSVGTWGWHLYRWAGTGTDFWNPHYEYGQDYYGGTLGAPKTAYAYRCVWREAEAESFLSCPADEVQMRDESTGAYSCVESVPGDSGGQQNPSNFAPFVDAWGNAFDLFERASATFPVARSTCESLGARLPVATELYRLRYQQGVVGTELGQPGSATQNYIWTLNPDYRENYQIQLRLSDGVALAVASNGAAVAPYRCVWPASRPSAFSGHACYGDPSAPCFETGRLRTDRYHRAIVPQAAAKWECRYFGGRLPTARDFAQLQHAGLPNSVAGRYEWTRDWSYWSDGGTYIYAPARGTNATQANWQFDTAFSEHQWYGYSSHVRFRCVFSDYME